MMDLLDRLLAEEGASARQELLGALNSEGPAIEERTFNAFDVTLDLEAGEAGIYDDLDGDAEPAVITFEELRHRLE